MAVDAAVGLFFRGTALLVALFVLMGTAHLATAQDNDEALSVEEVVVTGTRIKAPGLVSASPVYSIDSEDIAVQQEPEVEKILRLLPITLPGDNQNVNNGTFGAATIDPRGLGTQRSILLMDGKRMTPYNHRGRVDVSLVPSALIERVDILTGGASAVYGSDAVSGAVNFIMKRDFEGVDLRLNNTTLNGSDVNGEDGQEGATDSVSLTLGSNLADGRGNVVVHLDWTDREPLLLGALPFGQLGINTAPDATMRTVSEGPPVVTEPIPESQWVNAGYASWLRGAGNVPPSEAQCAGPGASDHKTGSGSTTAIPTRMEIFGAGGTFGQFRNDRTFGTEECTKFNFNPYNFFQTPQEKYSGTAIGHFDLADSVEAYSRVSFSHITVVQQVAPSGTFGAAFWVPVNNPFLSAQAKQALLDQADSQLNPMPDADGMTPDPSLIKVPPSGKDDPPQNWRDVNNNGMVDDGDYLRMLLRRRTFELGFRDERYESDYYQLVAGVRGDFATDYNYDISYQYGESNRTTIRDGYTNLSNIANALDAKKNDEGNIVCESGPPCVPLDLFGGYGTITPEMANYIRAVALQQQKYTQSVFTASVGGSVAAVQLPSANAPLAFNFGYEKREEDAVFTPDECLKLAPASCQGGAGGNLLPIAGGFDVSEFFGEMVLPLVDGMTGVQTLQLEAGFRASDYDITGSNETWKFGIIWRPVDSLLVRVMQQRAVRAPNVGELFSPVTTGLDNASQDPCSVANATELMTNTVLEARCISTGMTAAQVGKVDDVISNQINDLRGSSLDAPPAPEEADSFTIGAVWTPSFDRGPIDRLVLSLDYYDIDISDIIGVFSAQEILDACYNDGDMSQCDKIQRVGGGLTSSAAGVERFTTNLDYLRAEGLEFNADLGFALPDGFGRLDFSFTYNQYLTHESQSSANVPVIDCKGYIATDCDGVFETRWVQRSTWSLDSSSGSYAVSLLWRHQGELESPARQQGMVFPAFRQIEAQDYLDLALSYATPDDRLLFRLSVNNLLEQDVPIVGQDIGSTPYNFGNTLPSHYDIFGRVLKLGLTFRTW